MQTRTRFAGGGQQNRQKTDHEEKVPTTRADRWDQRRRRRGQKGLIVGIINHLPREQQPFRTAESLINQTGIRWRVCILFAYK